MTKPDEKYITARNKFIFQADKHARRVAGAKTDDEWSGRFNRAYHAKMNELAVEAGLIAGGWYVV